MDQFKNIMIGIFVIAALSIMVFMMLFLHPNLGDEGRTIRVYFADIDKISEGTRVTFAGRPVGEVVQIREIDAGERVEHNGVIYVYELLLAIDSSLDVYDTDEFTARTSGLLGEKSVAITPRAPKKGQPLVPITTEIIYADETGSVEAMLKELKELSDKIEITLNGFIEAFDILSKEKVWNNIGTIASNIADVTVTLNQPDKINEILENAKRTTRNAVDVTHTLNQPHKINEILDNVRMATRTVVDFTDRVNNIFTNVQMGEGTLGKILVKDDFYLRLASLLSKGEVILNDINHYGLLFHLDKGWQRLRARRLNLLHSLSTPQQFRNYFNDEIDSISTSLERVADVIEQADACPCEPLWMHPAYQKVYGELLRRVATLEEYLQMFNQQVNESKVEETEFSECACDNLAF